MSERWVAWTTWNAPKRWGKAHRTRDEETTLCGRLIPRHPVGYLTDRDVEREFTEPRDICQRCERSATPASAVAPHMEAES